MVREFLPAEIYTDETSIGFKTRFYPVSELFVYFMQNILVDYVRSEASRMSKAMSLGSVEQSTSLWDCQAARGGNYSKKQGCPKVNDAEKEKLKAKVQSL